MPFLRSRNHIDVPLSYLVSTKSLLMNKMLCKATSKKRSSLTSDNAYPKLPVSHYSTLYSQQNSIKCNQSRAVLYKKKKYSQTFL